MKRVIEFIFAFIILLFIGYVMFYFMSDPTPRNVVEVTNLDAEKTTQLSTTSEEHVADNTAEDPLVPIPSDTEPEPPIVNPEPEEPVACTMDAKMCPDGSFVGRTGPDCTFASCENFRPDPPAESEVVYCERENDELVFCPDVYQPVCGMVEVQCVTTPCDPVPETFSNGCYACADQNVISYTDGACGTDDRDYEAQLYIQE